MRWSIGIFCLSIAFKVIADEPAMSIDSSVATYNGTSISLSGNVVVEHALGTITTQSMELTPDKTDNKGRLYSLEMKGKVNIALHEGGRLTCAKADVNCDALEGNFYSDNSEEPVHFTETCRESNGKQDPLAVRSQQMTVMLSREEHALNASPRRSINKIIADNNVVISYGNEFTATADHATYQRLPQEQCCDDFSKQAPGLISLSTDQFDGTCKVANQRGDMILAKHICIDTAEKKLLFAYPQGTVYAPWDTEKEATIDFASDMLTWNAKDDHLTLQGHVVLRQQGMGTIINDNAIHLIQQNNHGKKQLHSIESSGQTVLTYTVEDNLGSRTLTCYGTVTVDHQNLRTIMESPRDAQGTVLDGQQIVFQDDIGEIYTDKLTIYYTITQNAPEIEKLLLEGNVQMRGSPHASSGNHELQYALADVVEYTPRFQQVHLKSIGNRRVLFFDKLNNLQVSAPALIVHRDKSSNKDSIKGQGDVRFSFLAQELEKFQEYFQDTLNPSKE